MSNEYKVRDMLVLEEDRQKPITIGKDKFIIKAPFPLDKKEIERRIVLEQNGLAYESYDRNARYLFRRDATLVTLIHDAPEWWTNPDDVIDEDLKDQLYSEITKWDEEFQEKLKKNKFTKRDPKS